jgi:uncharacterized coiled-coil protein SlyX
VPLVKAMQEQQKLIEDLQDQLAEVNKELKSLSKNKKPEN